MEHYLDNSATTAVSEPVARRVLEVMTSDFGNPSSLHRKGFQAERILTDARGRIASVLAVSRDEIVFTSGGTESNNLALLGAARARRRRGRHLVVTGIEHPSVLAAAKALEAEGFSVTRVPPEADGRVDPRAFADACGPDTVLASCMMVNSETGAVNDIAAIAREAHGRNPDLLFHSDCVQAFCRYPIRPGRLGVQLASFSGHKIHAPKGTGALYVASGIRLDPPLFGSGQERGLRPGTENVPGLAGFGLAASLMAENLDRNMIRLRALYGQLRDTLRPFPFVRINSGPDSAPYIVNLSVLGVRSEVMLHFLERSGVYVSSGSACSRGARSHVLTAMGLPAERVDSAIRISMTDTTGEEDIAVFCEKLEEGFRRLVKTR